MLREKNRYERLGEWLKSLDTTVREGLPKKETSESSSERASRVKSWETAFQKGKASAKVLRQGCASGVQRQLQ